MRRYYRNRSRIKVIAPVLVELGYIEEIGLGIRPMREEMASLSLPEPEFRKDGFSFVSAFCRIAPREGTIQAADLCQAWLD